MLALEWLKNAHGIMEKLEATQLENIKKAATVMADSIEAGRWVHTFGCGHATIPVEEMYPRIGSFVGFHPLCELPLTFFTQIICQLEEVLSAGVAAGLVARFSGRTVYDNFHAALLGFQCHVYIDGIDTGM